MKTLQPMEIHHDDTRLLGRVALPEKTLTGPLPAVLVMHSGLGISDFNITVARQLAQLGYAAVVTDMFGADADTTSQEGAGRAFQALQENPERLRERAVHWFDAVAARPDIDAGRMAAIGYCFGGQCVLELARSGADLKAAVSYHGLLGSHAPATHGTVRGHVAAYCGARDPYAPMEHIAALRKELTSADASFQITVFGDAEHGFTDQNAAKLGRPGISYHALSRKVSWAGTLALLEDVLNG